MKTQPKKQTLARERALVAAIDELSPQQVADANAELVIGIYELLRVPLRVEIPTRSTQTKALVMRCLTAIGEAKYHGFSSRSLSADAVVA